MVAYYRGSVMSAGERSRMDINARWHLVPKGTREARLTSGVTCHRALWEPTERVTPPVDVAQSYLNFAWMASNLV